MKKPIEIAVIGGGPAGITAAIQSTRAGARTVLFEKDRLGGLIRCANLVENYPGLYGKTGKEVADIFAEYAQSIGVNVINECVRRLGASASGQIFEIHTDRSIRFAKSVIVATGTKPKRIEIPGLDADVIYSIENPEEFSGKNVVIIGGGDAALDQALRLSKFARIAIVMHSRAKALQLLVERCTSAGIKFYENTEVLSGEHAGAAYILHTTSGDLSADFIIAFVGREPNLDMLSGELQKICAGATGTFHVKTQIPGLYLAGDLIAGNKRQLSIAVGTGMLAAMEAIEYLTHKGTHKAAAHEDR